MYPRGGRGRGRGGYRGVDREIGAGGEDQPGQDEGVAAITHEDKVAVPEAGEEEVVSGNVMAATDGEGVVPENDPAASTGTAAIIVPEAVPEQQQEPPATSAPETTAPAADGDEKSSEPPKNLYSGQGAPKGRLALSAKRASRNLPEHLDLRERLIQQLVGCQKTSVIPTGN